MILPPDDGNYKYKPIPSDKLYILHPGLSFPTSPK